MTTTKQSPHRLLNTVLAGGVLAISGLLYSPMSGIAQDQEPPAIKRSEPSLADLKKGNPAAYLERICSGVDVYARAKEQGVLKGFLYEPTLDELTLRCKETLRSQDESLIKSAVEAATESQPEHEVGTMMPTIIGSYANNTPKYLIFKKELFTDKNIQNDADVASVVRHEVKHVNDFEGMRVGDITITPAMLKSRDIALDYFHNLLEARATYEELRSIQEERVKNGHAGVSDKYLGSLASSYAKYVESLKPTTETEKRVSSALSDECAGIKILKTDTGFDLKYNLFGVRATLHCKQ